LSFRLPVSGIAINADGTVVWADDRHQGIQFTKVRQRSHGQVLVAGGTVSIRKKNERETLKLEHPPPTNVAEVFECKAKSN
jgi:hypothetical protein